MPYHLATVVMSSVWSSTTFNTRGVLYPIQLVPIKIQDSDVIDTYEPDSARQHEH